MLLKLLRGWNIVVISATGMYEPMARLFYSSGLLTSLVGADSYGEDVDKNMSRYVDGRRGERRLEMGERAEGWRVVVEAG